MHISEAAVAPLWTYIANDVAALDDPAQSAREVLGVEGSLRWAEESEKLTIRDRVLATYLASGGSGNLSKGEGANGQEGHEGYELAD